MHSEKAKILFDTFPKSFWDAVIKNNGTILSFLKWALAITGSMASAILLKGNLNNWEVVLIDTLLWLSFFIILIVTVYAALSSPKNMLQSTLSILFDTALGDSNIGETYSSNNVEIDKTDVKKRLPKRGSKS